MPSLRPALTSESIRMTGLHDFFEHCGARIIATITSGSCDDPHSTGVRPVFGDGPYEPHDHYYIHGGGKNLRMYAEASHPSTMEKGSTSSIR
ncbi:hypothetical protein AVEN_85461-1 [Araneus ventricosus]|uniref:Uncharacterized protein n=1 Tax=Araneus ventricosus TaxID=182803 RepID=A0A4Y2GXH8_ARAVE|nr:hypothetical protein AVEN_85461-1 [Araneus ventricosus]